jgi:hypothetical protein
MNSCRPSFNQDQLGAIHVSMNGTWTLAACEAKPVVSLPILAQVSARLGPGRPECFIIDYGMDCRSAAYQVAHGYNRGRLRCSTKAALAVYTEGTEYCPVHNPYIQFNT